MGFCVYIYISRGCCPPVLAWHPKLLQYFVFVSAIACKISQSRFENYRRMCFLWNSCWALYCYQLVYNGAQRWAFWINFIQTIWTAIEECVNSKNDLSRTASRILISVSTIRCEFCIKMTTDLIWKLYICSCKWFWLVYYIQQMEARIHPIRLFLLESKI